MSEMLSDEDLQRGQVLLGRLSAEDTEYEPAWKGLLELQRWRAAFAWFGSIRGSLYAVTNKRRGFGALDFSWRAVSGYGEKVESIGALYSIEALRSRVEAKP